MLPFPGQTRLANVTTRAAMTKHLLGFLCLGLMVVSPLSCGGSDDGTTDEGKSAHDKSKKDDAKDQSDDDGSDASADDDGTTSRSDDDANGGSDADSISNSPSVIADVAADIYDALDEGEDLAPYISEVFAAFGVPTLTTGMIRPCSSR